MFITSFVYIYTVIAVQVGNSGANKYSMSSLDLGPQRLWHFQNRYIAVAYTSQLCTTAQALLVIQWLVKLMLFSPYMDIYSD